MCRKPHGEARRARVDVCLARERPPDAVRTRIEARLRTLGRSTSPQRCRPIESAWMPNVPPDNVSFCSGSPHVSQYTCDCHLIPVLLFFLGAELSNGVGMFSDAEY